MKSKVYNQNRKQHNYVIVLLLTFGLVVPSIAQTDLENINRGVVAVKASEGIYVGWRSLGTDPEETGFNLYRIVDGGSAEKLNEEVLIGATNYYDSSAVLTSANEYFVTPVMESVEQGPSDTVATWAQNYLNIPLQRPTGGTTPDGVNFTYEPNDASVADLDGDGTYEIVLKWNPTNAKDNSQSGNTGNVILDAYEMNGTHIWRVDLGINIRAGAHYTQFMVYDFDSDGKAEIAVRTSDGTIDGEGTIIGDSEGDYRNGSGYILTGPEYLTMFEGSTGKELASIPFEPARGNVNDWGDGYGNRVDRFLGAVAYLDGQTPSVVFGRGIYEKMELAAFNWDGTDFTQLWHFKTQQGYPDWAGMGSHNLSVGDLDQDGFDEILYGNCAIDHDGTGLWTLRNSIGRGSGDAMHLADIIPDRPGLEKWGCVEGESSPGAHLVDAKTGEPLWFTGPGDVGRATAGDLTPDSYGMEVWGGTDGLRSGSNIRVGGNPSSVNHVVWWDGDLSRELLNGTTIAKYPSGTLLNAAGCSSNNGSKSNPTLQADIFGDWREEVIWRTSDNNNLRIYTTTTPTEYRITTLMHDHTYRLAIAWQNNSYNQPPHTGYYLGNDMFTPVEEIAPSSPTGLSINVGVEFIDLNWANNFEGDLAGYRVFRSENDESNYVEITDTLLVESEIRDSSITLDVEYFYYVIAIDTFDNESNPSASISGLPTYKPDPPINIKGRNGYLKTFVFWEPSPTASVVGYNLYVRETGGGYTKLNGELITELESEQTGLPNNQTFTYLVTSVDDEGRESFYPDEVVITTGEPVTIQSEDAKLEGIFIESNHTGFNGVGFTNFDAVGTVEFEHVYTRYGGWYELVYRYALGTAGRTGSIHVNDSTFSVTMNDTGGWTNYIYDTVKVELTTGFTNNITFEATGGDFGNLDEIIIKDRTDAPEPEPDPDPEPVLGLDESTGLKVYPNPFVSNTTFELDYAGNEKPHLEIISLLGQVVRSVDFESIGSNTYQYHWDGTNTLNSKVSSGLYFATIYVGDKKLKTVRLALTR